MLAPSVLTEEPEVRKRLHDLFGLTLEELVHAIDLVAAARADHTDNDPTGTPGLLSYIHGTRQIRTLLRPKGWHHYREENVEGVVHPHGDLVVIYQNVDQAASTMQSPRAISGKGPGTDRAIDAAQGLLFSPEMEKELRRRNKIQVPEEGTGVWFLCASFTETGVAAELSLPAPLVGGNFRSFIERIFISREDDRPVVERRHDNGAEVVELRPTVTRK